MLGVLERNGIRDTASLVALSERELLALPRFGWGCMNEVYAVLRSAGLELAEDPYAPYVCAREGKTARDANLASFFLCDECAVAWQTEAFDGLEPEYVGGRVRGYCVNCNVDRPDVRLRQWILCGNCERVARSIGRSAVAERYVAERWAAVVTPVAQDLVLKSTDVPMLRRGPRGASMVKRSAIDFVAENPSCKPVFGFEMKTGRNYVDGVAPVGAQMGSFQLDVSDCDDITTVMERDGLPVYVLNVQVIDRACPPTLKYVALAAWWTDVFRMSGRFKEVRTRPRETRQAAYFDTAMFEPFDTFADHVVGGDYRRIAKRIRAEGIPQLYHY